MKGLVVLFGSIVLAAAPVLAEPTVSLNCSYPSPKVLGKIIQSYAEEKIKADCPSCTNIKVKVKVKSPAKAKGSALYAEVLPGEAVTTSSSEVVVPTASVTATPAATGPASSTAALTTKASSSSDAASYAKGIILEADATSLVKSCVSGEMAVTITAKYTDPAKKKQNIRTSSKLRITGALL